MSRQKDPPDLRPITGRALRSVADSLRPYLREARVLDLYSGKGRFGYEALEEGATSVQFVEKHPRVAAALTDKFMRFGDRAKVERGDVLATLKSYESQGLSFDVVFADPPFRLWDPDFAAALFGGVRSVLGTEAIFLVRYPKRMIVSLPSEGLSAWKTSVFGESELQYFQRES